MDFKITFFLLCFIFYDDRFFAFAPIFCSNKNRHPVFKNKNYKFRLFWLIFINFCIRKLLRKIPHLCKILHNCKIRFDWADKGDRHKKQTKLKIAVSKKNDDGKFTKIRTYVDYFKIIHHTYCNLKLLENQKTYSNLILCDHYVMLQNEIWIFE